jgi:ubiquinol-cytochrome c reductase cytochrome c subunit
VRRRLYLCLCISCAVGALAFVVFGGDAAGQGEPQTPAPRADPALLSQGLTLFQESCSSCHGLDARGVSGRGPSLHGVGARAADFYLSTGRMPLDKPGDEPLRRKPAFQRKDIDAIVAYIASFGGPGIPRADPEQGEIALGQHAFSSQCAGCHQVAGEGGLVTNARVPRVKGIAPTQIAEAVRIGPYLMPPFSEHAIDQHELDSIARYLEYMNNPEDRGGWGIGHLGPVPEGMVAWFIGLLALVIVIRLLGERVEGPRSE